MLFRSVHATAAAAADGTKMIVKIPKGAATPVPGSGIGTAAAIHASRCNTSNPDYGVYGRWNASTEGSGPVCVRPFKEGESNGGATAQGVTKDKISVVAVIPGQTQLAAQIAARTTVPQNRATGQVGNFADSISDQLQINMRNYETWGRDVEVTVYASTGDDEAAQRADAVAILTKKPFAVLDMVTTGLDTLDTAIAKAKVPVWGYSASTTKATAQAPYRWGQNDAQAATVAAGEVLGKQLVDKNATFGGDDVKAKKRTIGAVYLDGTVIIDSFDKTLAKYGGKDVKSLSYTGNGSVRGDPTTAATFAPQIVGQLKNAGVTTVALFSDTAMVNALMKQASEQQYFPEWFFSSAFYADIAVLARTNPADQMAHAFGLSTFSPYINPTSLGSVDQLTWYWGPNLGTTGPGSAALFWLNAGVHTAGPNLTPKTFAQGLFSIPAAGGAITGNAVVPTSGFGKAAGLPYDEYMLTGFDFAPFWWDPDTVGPSSAVGTEAKGVTWFVDGGKRYLAGQFPSKPFTYFSKDGALVKFDSYPGTPPKATVCTDCPSATKVGAPGAASQTLIVGKAVESGSQTGS